jgi:hypothetical protein
MKAPDLQLFEIGVSDSEKDSPNDALRKHQSEGDPRKRDRVWCGNT